MVVNMGRDYRQCLVLLCTCCEFVFIFNMLVGRVSTLEPALPHLLPYSWGFQ